MYDELVKSLRHCVATMNCVTCPVGSIDKTAKAQQRCVTLMLAQAADAIEELSRKYIEERIAAVELTGELASKPCWISVEEGLPEEDGMYLVHGAWSASGRKVTDTCEFYVHDGYFRAAWNFDVTHWMPLPQGPKEEA